MSAALEIMAIAALLAVFTFAVNKKVGNARKMKEAQARINEFQKRYAAAQKSGDKELIAKLDEEQKAMMGLTKEIMVGSFKPMLFTLLPALAVFYYLGGAYGKIPVVVTLPVLGSLGWLWWYILVAIAFGIVLEIGYRCLYENRKKA